jgi:hypothetical protein
MPVIPKSLLLLIYMTYMCMALLCASVIYLMYWFICNIVLR